MRVCFAYVALAPYGSPARLCRSRSIRLAFAAIATRYAAPQQKARRAMRRVDPGNASPFFHIAAGRFRSPSHVLNARNGGRPFPLACLKRPQRRASVPPHHLWRGGDRQAGGEVMGTIALPQRRGLKNPQSKMRRRDFLTAFGVCVKPHAAARVLRRMA